MPAEDGGKLPSRDGSREGDCVLVLKKGAIIHRHSGDINSNMEIKPASGIHWRCDRGWRPTGWVELGERVAGRGSKHT